VIVPVAGRGLGVLPPVLDEPGAAERAEYGAGTDDKEPKPGRT